MDRPMEEQGAEWELAQAEDLKAERERWAAALEASERQITHLTDKAAAIETSSSPWPAAGGLTLPLQRSGHECTGDGNGELGDEGGKHGHAPA